jgi:YVTN family beta-propeller protein
MSWLLHSSVVQVAVIAACACACACDPSSSDAVGGDMAENEAVEAAPLGVLTSRDEVVRGRPVYALNSGGTISTFAIGPEGTLVASGGLAGVGSFLRGIAVAPDGLAAYVLNSATGAVLAFAIDSHGALTPIGTPVLTDPGAKGPFPPCVPGAPTVQTPCPFGLALAPDGRQLYVANLGSNTVSSFKVLPDRTVRRLDAPVALGGIAPRGVAVSPDGRRLYVTLRDSDSIAVLAVSPSGIPRLLGTPVRVPGCTPSGGEPPQPECSPMFASITPDGRWLYVTNQRSGDLSTFAIDAASMLAPAGNRVPTGGRPEGIAISPDGRFLYTNSIDANAVSAFTIGPEGQLGPLGVFPTCENFRDPAACGAVATAVTPDGGAVYALNVFSDQLAAFTVDATGALVSVSGSPLPSGGDGPAFQGLAARPNQGPIALLRRATGVAGRPTVLDASRSFDRDGQVVRYDWDFGDGETASDAGATPSHVYASAGRRRVTVTVTDNEGCSSTLVFTGQTALCNGSRRATASLELIVRQPPRR